MSTISNSLQNYRDKWKLINKPRNQVNCMSTVVFLENSFDDLIVEKKLTENFFNYKFSSLANYYVDNILFNAGLIQIGNIH